MILSLNRYGEKELIRNRIRNIIREYGGNEILLDDAARVPTPPDNSRLWFTTDPSPIPNLVHRIGLGDFYHSGWQCVVKSIADICAMGAQPLGITIAVEFSADSTQIDDFDSFFIGAAECAKSHGTQLIGGNIKESLSGQPHAVSSAVGFTLGEKCLVRGATKPGDLLFVIDKSDFGGFWAGIASHKKPECCEKISAEKLEKIQSFALKPMAKLEAASLLLKYSQPSFCMDNSDGLFASVFELTDTSGNDIVLRLRDEFFSSTILELAHSSKCDPRVWAFGWGNYDLLCASKPKVFKKTQQVLNDHGFQPVLIGEVKSGTGKVIIQDSHREITVENRPILTGEQFSEGSFWQLGVASYIDRMMTNNLKEFVTLDSP